MTNHNNNKSLQKSRTHSMEHLNQLLEKGNVYKNKKKNLQSLHIKLN